MQSRRAFMMIGISLMAGLMAIVFAARWLNQQSALVTTKVAVAAADVSLGAALTSDHVKLVDWPSGAIPAGAYTDPARLKDRVVRVSVAQGEPILDAKLAPVGTRGGLSAVIAPGKRAITVRVNDVIGVSGFALPGNYVDVMLSTRDERKPRDDQDISKIVLEKILVLAVGEEAGRDDTKPKQVKAVTLEVTPAEAEAIDLARSVGQLSLVLRNQVDGSVARTDGITKGALLGIAPAPVLRVSMPVASPAPPRRDCVEVFNGRDRSQQCF